MEIRVSVRYNEMMFLIDLIKVELGLKYDFIKNIFDENILIARNGVAVAKIRTCNNPDTGKITITIDVTDKKLYEQLINIIKEAPLPK